ncbi:unnamed protein product [Rhizophagus irregularis]|nr:unnamed protein product [Rhizophagus irregularis]
MRGCQTDSGFKLHPIDYVYLTALVLNMSSFYRHHFTRSDDINNYPYRIIRVSVPLIFLAIMIRTANLLVMPAVALFTIITALNSCCVGKDTELHSDIVLGAA